MRVPAPSHDCRELLFSTDSGSFRHHPAACRRVGLVDLPRGAERVIMRQTGHKKSIEMVLKYVRQALYERMAGSMHGLLLSVRSTRCAWPSAAAMSSSPRVGGTPIRKLDF
jgi:hypothetical protein